MRKLPIAWHLHMLSGVTLIGVWLCFYANGLKHQTLSPNAITKRYQQTLPLMGATRPAGIKAKVHTPNKGSQAALITRLSVRAFAFMPDAGRVAAIRGSVWGFYHTTTTYTPSILHLTQTRCNSLTINALISVRYYKFYLHTLHTLHTATRHKHERTISRHRGAETSVAPTDCSTSLWRKTRRIRPNRLHDSGVVRVRCMQGSV